MTAPGTRKHSSAMSPVRKWSGLTPGQWDWARANGHRRVDGQDPAGSGLVMNEGFCCECGGWSVPHSGGVVSNVRAGYEQWGAHVEALADCPAPGARRKPSAGADRPATSSADPSFGGGDRK